MKATAISTESLRSAAAGEALRAANYPISRWYLRPLAGRLAAALASSPVRPVHLTLLGLGLALVSAAVLVLGLPQANLVAAAGVLAVWFCDRADGQLARLQRSASALGAWLDANVDELADVVLHAAVAFAAARETASGAPVWLLAAFLAGKYLMFYGIREEEQLASRAGVEEADDRAPPMDFLRRLYHAPGNADVRVHLLAAALLGGWLTAELALVAAYYNLRWVVRYGLVARRRAGR